MNINAVKSYQNYTAAELAMDPFFRQWVLEPDDDSDRFWQNFLKKFPSSEEAVLLAYETVHSETIQPPEAPLTDEEKATLKLQIYRRLDLTGTQRGQRSFSPPSYAGEQKPRKTLSRPVWLGIAASFTLVGLMTLWLLWGTSEAQLISFATGIGESKQIRLPDSSLIVLHANSTLTYSEDYDRTIQLHGEAYFDVSHHQDLTFTVQTGALAVTVLGTQFHVKDRGTEPEVALVAGKVQVQAANDKLNKLVLSPGEKARLSRSTGKLVRSEVDTRMYSALAEGKWFFDETSLGEIAAMIGDYYQVEVIFENDRQRALTMSAFIPVTDLDTLADVIARTMDCHIHLTEDKLFIQDLQ